MNTNKYHTPVLLKESIEFLKVKPGRTYIDCTLGGGGHTVEILKRGGIVLGIDVDQDAINYVEEKLKVQSSKFKINKDLIVIRGNFRDLKSIAEKEGFNQVDGILYDLGVSTYQLETKGRGFSFGKDEFLDMRMDKSLEVSAKDVVNTKSQKELYEIFTKFGEEKRAWEIADAVVGARCLKPIETTEELASLVLKVRDKKGKFDRTHPATRVFQALRLYVNNELANLKESLPQAAELLKPKSRLVVISFHSLEDRIVKIFFREDGWTILTPKPIRPSQTEIDINPRARSAKLRVAERTRKRQDL